MLQTRMMVAAVATITLLTPSASSHASATPASTTQGSFVTLPGGTASGYTVTGDAIMIRTASDRTIVVVRAAGLAPKTTYGVHVHNAPCSAANPGGGHYQHLVGGAVDADNEMWPTITTSGAGRGTGIAHHDHRARADAMAIVIHHPDIPAIRIACLDLV